MTPSTKGEELRHPFFPAPCFILFFFLFNPLSLIILPWPCLLSLRGWRILWYCHTHLFKGFYFGGGGGQNLMWNFPNGVHVCVDWACWGQTPLLLAEQGLRRDAWPFDEMKFFPVLEPFALFLYRKLSRHLENCAARPRDHFRLPIGAAPLTTSSQDCPC